MKNDLFNQTLLRKYSKDFKLTISKHELILKHIQKMDQGQFEAETKNYIYFYEVWLKDILGYDLDENVLFDEKEGEGRGKSEFILKSGDKKFMVVELKDQKTDLDKPQNRVNDKRTPVDQAFDYAQHTGDIDWILVSNYNEFRLYNWHKKGHYISFKVGELLDKTLLSYFLLTFSKKSHIETGYIDKLMDKTVVIERELEKEFYKLYNETRLMFIKEFEEINELSRLESIHYAQMIMNRYMFICFAEDIDLLPAQISTDTILNPILNGNLRHGSIWQRLNELFLDIDEGNDYKKISQYNGGIFKEDLDHLKIRDIIEDQKFFDDVYQGWKFKEYEQDVNSNLGLYGPKVNPIYRNLLTISTFDFSTELDVNILGHIFENSIGDIEELKEGSKGRRKKDGIYYTPNYITDYICKNTIIPYLSLSGESNTVKDLLQEYSMGHEIEKLDEKIKIIRIVDPACGSGAFLNKATDILLDIHKGIFEIKKGYKTSTSMRVGKGKGRRTENVQHIDLSAYVFDAIGKRREILLDNIYGVDLNSESVEITKLSLFLKVCEKGKKLPELDNNIKCGNSLIEYSKFTDNAFNWIKEFETIFDGSGFDIVVGNPPYVNSTALTENMPEEKAYITKSKTFKYLYQKWDLYLPFIEKGLQILKPKGLFAMIIPYPFLNQNYAKLLRKYIMEDLNLIEIVDLSTEKIFSDVIVWNVIPIISKENNKNKIIISKITNQNISPVLTKNSNELMPDNKTSIWNISTKKQINKDFSGLKTLGDFCFISKGMVLNANEKIAKGEFKKTDLISDKETNIHTKRYIEGKDILRYNLERIRYLEWDTERVPSKISRPTFKELHENPKILINKLNNIKATLDIDNLCCEQTIRIVILWKNLAGVQNRSINNSIKKNYANVDRLELEKNSENINLKFILGIINSNMGNYFLNKIRGSGNVDINPEYLRKIPIYQATLEQQDSIIEKVDEMLMLNKLLDNEIKGFKDWLRLTFHITKFSKKLDKYYKLSFEDFLLELQKKKIDIKQRKTQELLNSTFYSSLKLINPLTQDIKNIDDEIDQIVYDLYDLNEDDIKKIPPRSLYNEY